MGLPVTLSVTGVYRLMALLAAHGVDPRRMSHTEAVAVSFLIRGLTLLEQCQ